MIMPNNLALMLQEDSVTQIEEIVRRIVREELDSTRIEASEGHRLAVPLPEAGEVCGYSDDSIRAAIRRGDLVPSYANKAVLMLEELDAGSEPCPPGALTGEETLRMTGYKTKAQALRELGQVVAAEVAIIRTLTVREAAERIYYPGGPSMEECIRRVEGTGLCKPDPVDTDQTMTTVRSESAELPIQPAISHPHPSPESA